MILYHGTSEFAAREAMRIGLRPRRQTGVTNWKFESNPETVYLTSTYACPYALNAKQNGVRMPGPKGEVVNRMAVIEIDTSRLPFTGFRADEDFLAFREAFTNPEKTVTDLVTHHAQNLTSEWKLSLKHLGTCGYANVIAPSHFTRVAFFEPKSNREMAFAMADGNVSPQAFKFAGHLHRAYTSWLFGDPVTALEILGYTHIELGLIPELREKAAYWEENILSNRAGIEIIEVKNNGIRNAA